MANGLRFPVEIKDQASVVGTRKKGNRAPGVAITAVLKVCSAASTSSR